MMSMKRNTRCKLALFLLLIFLIPFVPAVPVAADPLPVQVPDFPYGQDDYYNVNNGGFALWQVHGSNYVSYVQTFSPGSVGKPDPIVIFNKTLFYDNYTYYLDVNYITDTWDIYGYHIDGWPGSNTSNIRVPRPLNNPEIPDSDVYATLVYCSDDVRWRNGSDTGIYMYMNYLVPGYADPTPTPVPDVPNVIVMYGDYEPFQLGDIPNYGNDIFANGFEATGEVINIANALPGHQPTYSSIFAGVDYDNNHRSFFGIYITDSDTMDNPLTGSQFDHIVYGPYTSVDGTVTKYVHYFIRAYSNHWSVYGKPNLNNVNVPEYHWENSGFHKVQSAYYPYLAGYGRCDFYGFNGQSNPNVSPTPTPTAVPTAIPQPTQNPDPTSTPEPDVKVVTPSDHWWDGLVKPIQYIFVPSQDKMMKLYNTFANKFGVQQPAKFEFSIDDLVRPDNVVFKFHPIPVNGQTGQTVNVTLVDFKMVDDWLDSSPGQMIIRIVRAVFSLLMFGYLIYVFRKHIATINYTDAETLSDVYNQQKGGDE